MLSSIVSFWGPVRAGFSPEGVYKVGSEMSDTLVVFLGLLPVTYGLLMGLTVTFVGVSFDDGFSSLLASKCKTILFLDL